MRIWSVCLWFSIALGFAQERKGEIDFFVVDPDGRGVSADIDLASQSALRIQGPSLRALSGDRRPNGFRTGTGND